MVTAPAFGSPPGPDIRDSDGRRLDSAREEALRRTQPTGCLVVIGRLYKHGSLSTKWTWSIRVQDAQRAPHDEELEGGARFKCVEVVRTRPAPLPAMTPEIVGLLQHDPRALGAALVLSLIQRGEPALAAQINLALGKHFA